VCVCVCACVCVCDVSKENLRERPLDPVQLSVEPLDIVDALLDRLVLFFRLGLHAHRRTHRTLDTCGEMMWRVDVVRCGKIDTYIYIYIYICTNLATNGVAMTKAVQPAIGDFVRMPCVCVCVCMCAYVCTCA